MTSNIQNDIEQLIFPLLKHLKQRSGKVNRKTIEAIEGHLLNLNRSSGAGAIPPQWGLTAREKEVCYLIKSGLTTKEIAELLCASMRTIDNHRNHIRKKLGVSGKKVDLGDYLKQSLPT